MLVDLRQEHADLILQMLDEMYHAVLAVFVYLVAARFALRVEHVHLELARLLTARFHAQSLDEVH